MNFKYSFRKYSVKVAKSLHGPSNETALTMIIISRSILRYSELNRPALSKYIHYVSLRFQHKFLDPGPALEQQAPWANCRRGAPPPLHTRILFSHQTSCCKQTCHSDPARMVAILSLSVENRVLKTNDVLEHCELCRHRVQSSRIIYFLD